MEQSLQTQIDAFLEPDILGREPDVEDYSETQRQVIIVHRIDQESTIRKLSAGKFDLLDAVFMYVPDGTITLASHGQTQQLDPETAEYCTVRQWIDLWRTQKVLEQ